MKVVQNDIFKFGGERVNKDQYCINKEVKIWCHLALSGVVTNAMESPRFISDSKIILTNIIMERKSY